MKIAYLFHMNETYGGVSKKITSQIAVWKANGHTVAAFQVTRTTQTSKEQWHVSRYNPSVRKLNTRLKAWDNAAKDILSWSPDVVYYRYDMYYPALRRLVENIPVIVEINTDDAKEYCLSSPVSGLYNFLTRGLLLDGVSGMVFVANELASSSHFQRFNKRHITIGNGINLEIYEQLPPARNKYPCLVFMGSPGQPWHGVDKIVKLAQGQPLWRFDLIGITQEALGAGNQENIICHGYMDQRDYLGLLAAADIAIGTMALHRKNMNEATPLKVREYLAFGLPTIIGYKDTDFPSGAPFLLELSNCENNISENMETIQAFVEKWMGIRVGRNEVTHLDLKEKERQRLEFIKEVISDF